ncbi:MAG: DUF6089 family protein [Saprospiraceae bacterium]
MKKVSLLLVLLSFSFLVVAQRGWEAGFWGGTAFYFGDLNTSYNLSMPGFAGGVAGRFNFNNRLALKFSANAGQVRGDDAVSKNTFERARNLSFRSNIVEGAAQLEFNFLPYTHGSYEEFYTPYVFAGFNVFHYNPQAEYQGNWVDLRELGTEGQFKGEEYFSVSGGLVYGMGLKLDLSYEWSINLEVGARTLFTDYIDDVSGSYADKEDLLQNRGAVAAALSDRSILIPGVNDGQIGEPGTQRGGSSLKDSYVMIGLGIVYYFGDLKCPTYGSRRRR